MEQRLSQEVFYGSAIAALCGLLFGLLLHIPWEKHPGGPQILFSRAEAAELPRVDAEKLAAAAPADRPIEMADEDTGHVPPEPLPVTRLRPQMFDVQPAAADDEQRVGVDDAIADADAAPEAPRALD
jgi:hypothetical protein